MSIVPPSITPVDLSAYPTNFRSYSDVTPMSYESAMTYQEVLESLRHWIPEVLIPSIALNFDGFEQSWEDQVTALEDAVNNALSTQATNVNAQIAQALSDIANSQIDVTDPAFLAVMQNAQTQSRIYLDQLYGGSAVTDANIKTQISGTTSVTRDYFDARYDARYNYRMGRIWIPAATGDATTDTNNFKNTIATAESNQWDVLFTGRYELNQQIIKNLNRGSLLGVGEAKMDFYNAGRNNSITNTAVLVLSGNGTGTSPTGNPLNHAGTKYRAEGFTLNGPDQDYVSGSTPQGSLDGILFTDPGIGADLVTVRHLKIYGFRDGITYLDNTWSQSVERTFIWNSHRYGVNLYCRTNSGECTTFLGTTIAGTHNANGTGTAVYAPDGNNVEFRMIGGSLDYNDVEGAIYGGSLSFSTVHIEDNGTGAMFVYKQTSSYINVTFRDCAWDSAAAAFRPYIHQVLSGSGSAITILFEGDKGGVYPNTYSVWFQDDTNNRRGGDLGISARFHGFRISGLVLLGQHASILSNGDFSVSSSFVASPGVNGWYQGNLGSWSIGSGGSPGSGLKVVSTTAITTATVQRVPVSLERPYKVAGKMMVAASSGGSIQVTIQYYDASGNALPTVGSVRIGSTLSTVDASNWTFFSRTFTTPPGAAYMSVQLGCNSFIGTAYWDEIEVVPV